MSGKSFSGYKFQVSAMMCDGSHARAELVGEREDSRKPALEYYEGKDIMIVYDRKKAPARRIARKARLSGLKTDTGHLLPPPNIKRLRELPAIVA